MLKRPNRSDGLAPDLAAFYRRLRVPEQPDLYSHLPGGDGPLLRRLCALALVLGPLLLLRSECWVCGTRGVLMQPVNEMGNPAPCPRCRMQSVWPIQTHADAPR